MKPLTVKQAMRAGHCSKGTIYRLIADKKIQAVQEGRYWMITNTASEVEAIVTREVPNAGWHKTTARKKNRLANGLAPVMEFAALPIESRRTLLKLAKKFSSDELQILLTL